MTAHNTTNTIYLDMDGVLVDFHRAVINLLGMPSNTAERTHRWDSEQWTRLRDVPNLYRNMPKMAQADLLFAQAQQFKDYLGWDLKLLTAIPSNNGVPSAFHDKIDWANEFYPGVRVHFGPYSNDKASHCKPGDILVDDRDVNCNAWREAGGYAVKVNRGAYSEAIAELTALYQARLKQFNIAVGYAKGGGGTFS